MDIDPASLAYVIYTSGSTGRAKGVAVEHRQLANYVHAALERLELPPGASFATVSTFAADLGHTMIFPALASGGHLHVIAQETLGDAARLAGSFRRHAIDCLKIVPSHLQALLAAAEAGVLPRQRLVLGGEASTWDLIASVQRLAPGCRIFNHYGPTETTVGVLVRPVGGAAPDRRSPRVPLGRPLAGCRIYLLGPGLDPAGTEEPGEIHIGGLGVARGYLGRPDLTAERFLPDPWGFEPGARMYRTGDLARRRLDGEIEFLGRLDYQIKVRGFRVELGEIEAALRAHPGVADAVVIAQERAPGEVALTAFCLPTTASDTAGLRDWLAERLPDFMIPARIVPLPALPLTANGKVDRQVLPALAAGSDGLRPPFQPPATPGEELLAGIFGEILKVERIGRQDDFFALGGHSLLVTQLVSRVRRAFGVELSLRTIFERPTVEALAGALAELAAAGSRPLPPIERVPRQGRLPLSSSQARLWFLEQLRPGQATYNLPVALRLRGRLDRSALQRALGEIVRRHEVLRTCFPALDGEPHPVIATAGPVDLPRVDLGALSAERREREAARLCEEEARRPFDLAAGPVLRAVLAVLGPDDHAVALTLHHIAGDRWSLAVLVREVAALYRAFATGSGSPLPELPVQYVDFAAWQRSVLEGDLLESQLAYWRQRLAGAPPVLTLPADRPRPPVLGPDGGSLPIRLAEEIAGGVRRLARNEGATPFMVLLAALQALLARLSGQDDVPVGIPIAGRREAATEAMIGFFVNTLVLRTPVRLKSGLRELLQTVRQLSLEAYAHQDLPFERLVNALAPERSLSYSPLFQVAFAFQNVDLEALQLPGLETTLLEAETRTAKFDLTFSVEDGSGALAGSLEYCRDLFDAATAARILGHWRTLLAAMVSADRKSLEELPLMEPEERHQILWDWNDTAGSYPREATLPELFAETAGRYSGSVAVTAGRERLTYAELLHRSRRLAARLRSRGVGPEVLVGVFLERSPAMIVGLLGILEAGGAYLPLDLSYPPARLATMLADAGWPLVLTRRDLVHLLPDAARTVAIDDGEPAPAEVREAPAPCADNLAYVLFTSGSTGQPKGAAVTHRAVVRLVRETNFADLGPDQTVLQFAPTSFDASTLEIWGPLLNGGRLALFPDTRASVEELGRFVESQGVTTLWLTAGLFHQRVEAGLGPLRAVRQLLAGGDVLSPSHVRQALAGLPGAVVINGYGPTENTTFTTCHRLRPGTAVGDSVPIGRPVSGTTVYLLDEGMEPVPVGVAAELYTGGDGLARGYLGRSGLTAERFVPHPFAAGQRLYRTGDLARWRSDGSLEFLGRIDRQAKVRGFRIELGEIEACLTGHPRVRAAAVQVQGSGDGKRLAAFVAADALTADDLRRHLQSRLPEFMVPQAFVVLAELPLTPNGKVDWESLPPVETAADDAAAPPRSWIEEVLSGLWCETLGRDGVGRDESFFELGGHSLLATRLVSRIARTFEIEIPLQDLFENPSVAGLAGRIEERMREREAAEVPPIVPRPRDGRPLPLSFAQQRLWFLDQLEAGGPAFQVRTALRLSGELALPVLAASLAELVRRHESLRTTFVLWEGSPVQVIHSPAPVPLPLADLSALSDGAEEEAMRLVHREAHRPFDLARGPLARFLIVRLAAGEHVLLAAMHHIVSDGWSMEILIQETVALYEAFAEGRPSPLPEPALHYGDYAVWQRRWLRDGVLEGELAYWRHRLRDAQAPSLPADLPRPAVQTFRGAGHRLELTAELSAALRQLSRQEGITLFALLVAAVKALLCHWTGAEDVVVGANAANRSRPGSEQLIGFLVNQLVLRTDLTGNPSFREILRRVWRGTLEAYAHQDLPFDKLVEELRPRREAGSSPFFQVKIDLEHALPACELPGLSVRPVEIDRPWSHFDLLLQFLETPAGLSLHLRYNRDLFTSARMLVLLRQLEALLEIVAREPDIALAALRPKLTEVAVRQERAAVESAATAARLELARIQPRAARQAG